VHQAKAYPSTSGPIDAGWCAMKKILVAIVISTVALFACGGGGGNPYGGGGNAPAPSAAPTY
jgi:hypothetical protein